MLLDGRPVRTPARALLAAPVRELAQAIAAEWHAQQDKVDPAAMPLTRLANSIIDGVAPSPAPVAAEIEKYLGTDLLFYRAVRAGRTGREPARALGPDRRMGARETRRALCAGRGRDARGRSPKRRSRRRSRRSRAAPNIRDAWRLGALDVVTTLTGSALLALALAAGRITTDEAWTAAHVDEDWNMQFWGRDEVILARRAYRFAEMQAAAGVLDGAALVRLPALRISD